MKKVAVKKFDVSALISNLLVVSSVMVASLPLFLGDNLVLLASNVVREGTIVLQEFSTSLQMLLS